MNIPLLTLEQKPAPAELARLPLPESKTAVFHSIAGKILSIDGSKWQLWLGLQGTILLPDQSVDYQNFSLTRSDVATDEEGEMRWLIEETRRLLEGVVGEWRENGRPHVTEQSAKIRSFLRQQCMTLLQATHMTRTGRFVDFSRSVHNFVNPAEEALSSPLGLGVVSSD